MSITLISRLIGGIIGVLISTIICHILLTRRKSITYCILLFTFLTAILAVIIVFAARSIYANTPLGKYIVFVIIFCYNIYNCIVFEESFAKKLFTMLSIWMISITFSVIDTSILQRIINKVQFKHDAYMMILMKFSLDLVKEFVQLGLFITIRKTYKYYIQFIDDKTFYFMCLYTFIGLLFSYENYRNDLATYANINIRNMLLFVSFIILGYINVCIAIMSTKKAIMLNNDIKMTENQLNLQRENYRSLIEFAEDRSRLKHDLRHHILAVKSMLETGNSENALQYIQQFNQSEMMKDMPMLCMNLTADSLIKYYMSIALNKGIDFRTKLNIPEDININSVDLSVILGNCIENAINECDKLYNGERSYIELKSNIIGQNLVIQIKNSFSGIVKRDGEAFLSSRHAGYGIGISSVMAATKKYKGNMDIKYTDNEFEVNVILVI